MLGSLTLASLMVILLVLPLTPAHAVGPTLVQQNGAYVTTGSTSALAFSSTVTSGDVVVVAIDIENQVTNTVTSVTDSLDTSYTQASASPSILASSDGTAYLFYGTLSSSGTDTITITQSAPGDNDVFLYEVSGVTTVGAVSAAGTSGEGTTASLTTSSRTFSAPAFLVATTQTLEADTCTAGAGFTCSAKPASDAFGLTEYSVSGVSSPTTFPMTLSQADRWDYVGLALTSGTATPPPAPALVCPNTFGGVSMPLGATFKDTSGHTWLAPSGNQGGGMWSSYFFAGSQTSFPLAMMQGWGGDYGTYNGQGGWVVTFFC